MGHHSAQHTLSLSCFQYGAMPSPSHGLVSPGPDHLGVSPCRRQPLPLCCQGGRGAVSRPSGLGEGTLGSQGSLGNLPSTSVFQVIICTDAWKYQVPSNLGLSGVLQHKWTQFLLSPQVSAVCSILSLYTHLPAFHHPELGIFPCWLSSPILFSLSL